MLTSIVAGIVVLAPLMPMGIGKRARLTRYVRKHSSHGSRGLPTHAAAATSGRPYFAYKRARLAGSTLILVMSPPAQAISFGSITLNHSHGIIASPKLPG